MSALFVVRLYTRLRKLCLREKEIIVLLVVSTLWKGEIIQRYFSYRVFSSLFNKCENRVRKFLNIELNKFIQ